MNEQFVDRTLSIPENVTKLVLEAKLKNLPFSILRGGLENLYNEEHFERYKAYIEYDKFNKNMTRTGIDKDNLGFFPEWEEIQRALTKIYGNPTNVYNSIMQTSDHTVNKVHASLHHDRSDVVHLACYGQVEWLLIDPEDKKEYKITLGNGDILYMRGLVLHETVPLSPRGSIIFMNLSYEEFPDYLTPMLKDKTKEEIEEFQKNQRAQFLENLNKRV
jgi:hypothetical protein